jgi:hypothetical protein
MLKIPKVYQHCVKVIVTETLQCTCQRQRCIDRTGTPKTWEVRQLKVNDDDEPLMPESCPRCRSFVWWIPGARP